MRKEPLGEVGEWRRNIAASAADLADEGARALGLAKDLGVKPKNRSRFDAYLPLLREASALDAPILSWPHDKRRLYYESVTQTRCLVKAAEVWPDLAHTDALVNKVTKALAGNALPVNERDRQARDFMVEFSTAYLFKLRGHGVDMPTDDRREDVRVTVADVGDLVVECKRPQSVNSIYDKLREGCDKLSTLCDGKERIGTVVIGIDRILDGCIIPATTETEREIPSVENESTLQSWFETMIEARIFEAVLSD